jgi:hypothetical protein
MSLAFPSGSTARLQQEVISFLLTRYFAV